MNPEKFLKMFILGFFFLVSYSFLSDAFPDLLDILPSPSVAYQYYIYVYIIVLVIAVIPWNRLFPLKCPHDKTSLTYLYANDRYDIYTCRYGHEIRKKKSIRTHIRNLPFYMIGLRRGRFGGGGRGSSGGGFGGGSSGGGGAGR